MIAQLREVDWHLPGCGAACRETRAMHPVFARPFTLVTHDPEAHEEYGRAAGRMLVSVTELGAVTTGGITVDHDRAIVLVDGDDIHCTPVEMKIMVLLSSQVNRTYSRAEILYATWGNTYVSGSGPSMVSTTRGRQIIRVNVARLRDRLGAQRRLLVTQRGTGYRLLSEAP